MKRRIVFWVCLVVALVTAFVPQQALAMKSPVLLGVLGAVRTISTAGVFLFVLMVVPPNWHADLRLRIKRPVTKSVVFGLSALSFVVSLIILVAMIRQQSMALFDLMFSFQLLGGKILALFYLMVALDAAYHPTSPKSSKSFFSALFFRVIVVAVIVPMLITVLSVALGKLGIIYELASTATMTGVIIGIVGVITGRPKQKETV